MRIVVSILKWAVLLVVLGLAGFVGWLHFAPPALIRVAAGYSAKIVCSNVFVAGRDAGQVLALDVQAPGHWLLKYIDIDVDRDAGTVSAGLFGMFGNGLAVYREGLGCASAPTIADVERLSATPGDATLRQSLWPRGDLAELSQDPEINAILDDESLTGPGMRAVVVAHNGRIIGERYAEEFTAVAPLLGWSMSKTVTAAIIGTLVKDGTLERDQQTLFQDWSGDERAKISLADMMAMTSGLEFNEDYGDVTDVTRMLYLEPDMAGFASDKPLAAEPRETWSYSSGTTVMLSRIWQDAVGEPQEALDRPREALFDRIGMTSGVLEADAAGTFVGSSYLYATARDWARFGQFLIQDGEWDGEKILPDGYVDWMREPVAASNGEYGRGQLWLHGPAAGTPEGEAPDDGFDLPDDTFWALGHDGQSMAMIPSQNLVVVRLGLTPSSLGYKSQGLVEALVNAVE